ncbi:penicillin-binding protein 2 [Spirulina sp. CS-785/01]|uniref:peptidoglycan D,D-transpeptidase FtsI family protein n=1 Tax=Spirulina sp. CS-785/01 TaxID=3021716 RepID=UPI0023312166|nr:penicillin-binding protein 2 [Spirulina sp. CS-785/01]MDB9314060.1 penicillin-binding protein 2 [Spirulina sp. CS-785/01]
MADSKVTPLRPRQKKAASSSPGEEQSPKRSSRRRKPPKTKVHQHLANNRLLVVWAVLLAGVGGLGLNLYNLQVVQSQQLARKAQQQQMIYMRPYIPRRPIVDRNGNVLATDRLVYTLYAHPNQFKRERAEIASALKPIIGQDIVTLLEKFEQKESGIPIAYELSEEEADQVAALSWDGLELIRQYSRLYPQQELASEVVGYVDLDHKGQAGLEYTQERLLERNVRTLHLNRAGNGALMPNHVPEGFLEFDERRLQLTLDVRLQRMARSRLKQTIEKYNAKRGTVIVMDVRDGSLLSLVCEPTFDPNEYSKFPVKLFKSWAVTDLYEPGSTFKPINVAIALEEGAIQPDDLFEDKGKIVINGWPISNYDYLQEGGRGPITIEEILVHSSNVAMVDLIRHLDVRNYYNALLDIELLEKTGIELPSEGMGQLKSEEDFARIPVEIATAAFGQGFSLTPLKLAQLHAALANGGTLVTPHLIEGLVNGEGEIQDTPPPRPTKQIFSPETTRIVLNAMERVIEADSGERARIENYRIAGKSGTAQKASPDGGYLEYAKVVSFVTAFPVEDPKYLVLAVIDEPKGNGIFGSTVAAPIVKSVMEALIALEGIPPSNQ